MKDVMLAGFLDPSSNILQYSMMIYVQSSNLSDKMHIPHVNGLSMNLKITYSHPSYDT